MASFPIPGDSGIIECSISDDKTYVKLTWAIANDALNVPTLGYKYEVRKSKFNIIDTLPNALANGKIVKQFTTDLTSITAKNDSDAKYFVVIVKDPVTGNKETYQVVQCGDDLDETTLLSSSTFIMWTLIFLAGLVFALTFVVVLKYINPDNKIYITMLAIIAVVFLVYMLLINV